MVMLQMLRIISLIIFWPALGFGIFASLAKDFATGSVFISVAAAAGVWAVVCTVADRVVLLLDSINKSLMIVVETNAPVQAPSPSIADEVLSSDERVR